MHRCKQSKAHPLEGERDELVVEWGNERSEPPKWTSKQSVRRRAKQPKRVREASDISEGKQSNWSERERRAILHESETRVGSNKRKMGQRRSRTLEIGFCFFKWAKLDFQQNFEGKIGNWPKFINEGSCIPKMLKSPKHLPTCFGLSASQMLTLSFPYPKSICQTVWHFGKGLSRPKAPSQSRTKRGHRSACCLSGKYLLFSILG